MKHNQKQTARYTGICYTVASDNQPSHVIAESYGNDKDTVLKKALAGALCFNETSFSILTTQPGKPDMIEHYTITDPATGNYTPTN